MWPVPKNVSSASRSFSLATFSRRRVTRRPRRFVRFAATNFFDREFEVLQEVGPDRALRIRVGSGRERYLRGERARDCASLPLWRAVDPGMLEDYSMFRRPRPGPQMAKQGALRTEELDRPGGRPREVLDSTREGDEPGREDRTRDRGDVRREFAGRSLHVRFDRFPLISHELREAGEGLQLGFLPLRELRSDALAMIDWHLFSSPVHRHELDVCRGVDHGGELGEVEPVPLSQPLDEDILFFLQLVEGPDGLAQVVFRSDRLAHPSFRQLHHGGVQKVAAVAEVLGFEERRAPGPAVAPRSLETGLAYQDLRRARHQVAVLRQDFPLFPERETVPQGRRFPRGQSLLDDGRVVEQERAEPSRQEEHRAGRNGSVRKSVSAYRDLARAFFFGAARPDGRSWEGFKIPCSVMIPVMYLAGVTSKDGLRAKYITGIIGCPSRWRTSCGDRSSMGILAPDARPMSIVLVGAAT